MSTQKKAADRLIVGISGASGAVFGIRLLEACKEMGVESHLVVTKPGAMTIAYETELSLKQVAAKATHVYAPENIAAPIASGSFRTAGMIVAPCSVKALSEIATGVTTTLLSRAADVCLKERRQLVLMVRETPLHLGHIRAMAAVTEMGGVIMPPVPAFYAAPETISDMVDQMVARALDLFGYNWPTIRRWGEDVSKGRRQPSSKAGRTRT